MAPLLILTPITLAVLRGSSAMTQPSPPPPALVICAATARALTFQLPGKRTLTNGMVCGCVTITSTAFGLL